MTGLFYVVHAFGFLLAALPAYPLGCLVLVAVAP